MSLNSAPSFSNGPHGKIAFLQQSGAMPGVIFIHGFKSDMLGGKAEALAEFCAAHKRAFLRFDCRAHGQSAGAFEDFTIGGALADCLHMLDHLTEGPQIIVGSSMGGWLAFLLALHRPQRVKAIIGIALAPDFTDQIYHDDLNDAQRAELDTAGQTFMPSDYGDPYLITKQLIDDGRHHFVMNRLAEIKCPLHILHGQQDDAVDWRQSEEIIRRWGGDAKETFIKDGDHRLSREEDLAVLRTILTHLF